jgi:flavin-dependent dehydrogenase
MLRRPGNLKHTLQRYTQRIAIGSAAGCRLRAGLIPVSPRTDGFVRGRVLLTGDAAGLADPLTAEGLSHALLSGRLAAGALLASGFDPGMIRQAYHRRLKAEILDELRLAQFFARLVFFHPRVVSRLFGLWGQDFVEGVTDIACGRRTYRSLLCNPVNYNRLLTPRA